jgi:hypothetical protein
MKRNKVKPRFIRPKKTWIKSSGLPLSNSDQEPTPSELSFEEGIDSVESEGCVCKKCGDFFPFAEPNQEDKSFVCFACRNNI